MQRARIGLADDHPELLACTRGLLEPEFEIVQTAADGAASIEAAETLDPDVLVLDIAMPELDGFEVARRLQTAGSRTRIVSLTIRQDPDYIRTAFDVRAQGYVFKNRLVTDLALALREVIAGRSFVSNP